MEKGAWWATTRRYLVHFPVLYSRSLLVIYHIYILLYIIPNLLIYPSPLLPFGNHKNAFYVCECISILSISSL